MEGPEQKGLEQGQPDWALVNVDVSLGCSGQSCSTAFAPTAGWV